MKLLEKIVKFDAEAKSADAYYKQWGTTRDEHQSKMLDFIHKKMEEEKKKARP